MKTEFSLEFVHAKILNTVKEAYIAGVRTGINGYVWMDETDDTVTFRNIETGEIKEVKFEWQTSFCGNYFPKPSSSALLLTSAIPDRIPSSGYSMMQTNRIYFVVEQNMMDNKRKLAKLFLKKEDAVNTAKWLNEDLEDISITYTVEEWRKHE